MHSIVIQSKTKMCEKKCSIKTPYLIFLQMLQEARQRASEEEKERAIDGRSAKNSQKPSFEQAWEDSEGPVHLEALSLVAKQCQSKKTSMVATLPHYVQDKLHSNNTVIKVGGTVY